MSQGDNLTINGAGQATAAAAGAVIATVALPTESNDVQASFDSSKWRVDIDAGQSGTVDTANLVNLGLYSGTRLVGKVTSAAYPFRTTYRVVFPGPDRATDGTSSFSVKAIGTFAAASIASVNIIATREG